MCFFIVFVRDGCSFCHSLLKGLERLKIDYEEINYEVQEAEDAGPAPYILRLDENGKVIGKLIGFQEKISILNFLGIQHDEKSIQRKSKKAIKKFL